MLNDIHVCIISLCFEGVEIVSTQMNNGSTELNEGISQTVTFDVTLNSDGDAGSVAGTNLWQVTPFLSQDETTSVMTFPSATLDAGQGSTGISAGTPSTISAISATLDLTGGPLCSQFSFFCVTVDKGPSANPDFLLSGQLTACIPVTCQGKISSI